MPDATPMATLVLVGVTVLISYAGFANPRFFEKNDFHVGMVLGRKEYYRMISSGFLHVSWTHLLFNMFSFYSFARYLEYGFGAAMVLIMLWRPRGLLAHREPTLRLPTAAAGGGGGR